MPLSVTLDAPLARLNTFGVEARARRLVEFSGTATSQEAIDAVAGAGPVLVLGGGSNVLFAGDFDGTVLRVGTRGRRVIGDDAGAPVVEARAGEDWDGFVRWTLAQGLYGLENLALIPGSVGASPIQNIGAYGVEMRERFHGLSAVRIADGARRDFDAPACAFGYRDSVFKHADGAGWLVTEVRFRLSREPAPRTSYADLRDELARRSIASATPADVADAVSAIRRRKLPDPARLGNAGSFFRNPVLPADRAADLARRHPGLPAWPADGGVKLAAAWLIEQCGWKGRREGDAGVHAAHALVLVNHGRASGAQILALARRVRDSVLERYGVELEPEPLIVGAAWL